MESEFSGPELPEHEPFLAWSAAEAAAADVALAAAVERLLAADVEAARVAGERYRAIAELREASLRSDAARARWRDAQRGVIGSAGAASTAAAAVGSTGADAAILRATRASEVSERSARAEIGAALRMSEAGASALVDAARLMIERHPSLIGSLSAGRLRERHAVRLARAVSELPVEAAESVVAEALPRADRDFASFARTVDRLVRRHAPESPEEAHARAIEARAVWVDADRDGMAVLSALLPAVAAHAIHDRLTGIAVDLERDPAETRTRGQLRADVLCSLLIDGVTGVLPESARGIRPTVHVTVPVLALATGDARHGEAEVDGVGPIDRETAARLVGAASEWTRVLTHPVSGMALSVDRQRYRPPAALARLARWVHGTCTFPGCRAPAHRCELDHLVDWRHGGGTALGNLHPLCTSHHTIKHATRWRVESDVGTRADPGGGVTWTSPGGQVVRREPRHPVALPIEAPF